MKYLHDFLAVIAVGLIGYGAWLVYPPAAFITVGSLLLMAALMGARNGAGGSR